MDTTKTDTTTDARPDLDIEPESAPLPALRPEQEPRRVRDIDQARAGMQATDRVIVRHSEQIGELFAALAEAQCEVGYGDIEKTKTARIKSKREGGADYTYEYETLKDVLDATRPHLAKHGIAFAQFPFPGQSSVTIRTMLGHKSGQWIYNDLSAIIPMPDPQAVGSGISYLRRYAAKSILGVSADDEDDDGAGASRRPPERPRPAPPQPAARVSQARPAEPKAAEQKPTASPSSVGLIVAVEPRGQGVLMKLDSGYQASTKDPELRRALEGYAKTGVRVEIRAHASADPAKYAPVIDEILQQRGAAEA